MNGNIEVLSKKKKKKETVKKNQMGILELKNTISEVKTKTKTLHRRFSRREKTEESVNLR